MKTLVALLLTTTFAYAGNATITLNDEEQKALNAIFEVATGGGKPGGLEMAKAVVYFAAKIQQAAQPKPENSPPTPPPRPPLGPAPEPKTEGGK